MRTPDSSRRTSEALRAALLRAVTIVSFAMVLAAAHAAAQERRFQLFAGIEPAFVYSDLEGFEFEGGFQLGLGYEWNRSLVSEISVSRREGGFNDATIVDASALYQFPSPSRWRFFVGTGLHYSRVDIRLDATPGLIVPQSPLRQALSISAGVAAIASSLDEPEEGLGLLVTGGAGYDLSSRFRLRMDLRYVPWTISGDRDSDSDIASTFGVGFRF